MKPLNKEIIEQTILLSSDPELEEGFYFAKLDLEYGGEERIDILFFEKGAGLYCDGRYITEEFINEAYIIPNVMLNDKVKYGSQYCKCISGCDEDLDNKLFEKLIKSQELREYIFEQSMAGKLGY